MDEVSGLGGVEFDLVDLTFPLQGEGFELCIGLGLEHLDRGLHLGDV